MRQVELEAPTFRCICREYKEILSRCYRNFFYFSHFLADYFTHCAICAWWQLARHGQWSCGRSRGSFFHWIRRLDPSRLRWWEQHHFLRSWVFGAALPLLSSPSPTLVDRERSVRFFTIHHKISRTSAKAQSHIPKRAHGKKRSHSPAHALTDWRSCTSSRTNCSCCRKF